MTDDGIEVAPAPVETLADADLLAGQAWSLVGDDPARAHGIATRAVAAARKTRDHGAASVAHRALGMSSLELHSADIAVEHLRRAIRVGRQASDDGLVAEAEMSLALALQHRGDASRAIRHADAAVALAPGATRLRLQQALLLERLGRLDAALTTYREAERLAEVSGDDGTLARVLCNRGVLLTYRGDFADAESDLLAGEALCAELGFTLMAAGVRANIGYLAARRGDLVEALRCLESVRGAMESAGGLRLGIYELDRCEVLLLAGLPRDAVVAGRAAIAVLDRAGMQAEAAEARLITAQAALRDDDAASAESLADTALRAFARQRREPWSALAREVVVRAQLAGGRRDGALLDRARQVASALDAAGWPTAASSARLLSARLALDLGRTACARSELQLASIRRTGSVGVRVQARLAEALLRLDDGNRRGAQAALRAGWRALEEHRATLGATELRVGAGAYAVELSALGLRMALEARRPEQVLAWAERGRAGALYQPPARAPQGTPLAAALDALRSTVADLDAAAKDGADTRALQRRQASLEEEVRRQAQLASAEGGETARTTALETRQVSAELGDAALVELVVCDGALHAVVLLDDRVRLHDLGCARAAAQESEALRMALRRLTNAGAPAPLRKAARAAAAHAAANLADQILTPMRACIEGRPLVLVPTGALHGTPWPALPGIPAELTIAPSASLWLRGRERAPEQGPARGTLIAAGPQLQHADDEVAAVGALYPGAAVLSSQEATVDLVRHGMADASLAHLACHGRFRADNPLFSALEFTGGHLSVFELERLGRVPERLVLSACDSGLSAVRPGDELMGLTATLLRLGTRSLVASVLPVPDGASRRLMVELHRSLAAGAAPPAALAAARAAGDPEADDDLVAAAAFTAFGSD